MIPAVCFFWVFFVYNERKLKSLVFFFFFMLQDCCFCMVCLRVTGISVIRIICKHKTF